MRFSENKSIACAALALVIAATLIFGGGGALRDWRNEVSDQFYANRESISAELTEMQTNAGVLISIAREYEDADEAYIADADEALNALSEAGEPGEKFEAAQDLSLAVENLYSDLGGLKLSEMDVSDVRYKYKNFTSAQLRISHDEYNERAAEFNRELQKFPANLLGMLNGVRPLGLYQ